MRDEFRDVDFSCADQFEGFSIDAGTTVRVKAARSPGRRDECRFDELNVVENAQVDAVMAMPVKNHSRLFAQQPWDLFEQLRDAGGFDQQLNSLAARQFL